MRVPPRRTRERSTRKPKAEDGILDKESGKRGGTSASVVVIRARAFRLPKAHQVFFVPIRIRLVVTNPDFEGRECQFPGYPPGGQAYHPAITHFPRHPCFPGSILRQDKHLIRAEEEEYVRHPSRTIVDVLCSKNSFGLITSRIGR
jgi:hypothetical protein